METEETEEKEEKEETVEKDETEEKEEAEEPEEKEKEELSSSFRCWRLKRKTVVINNTRKRGSIQDTNPNNST